MNYKFNLNGPYFNTMKWKRLDEALRDYFDKNEAYLYDEKFLFDAKKRFVRWGKSLLKNGDCLDLLELLGNFYKRDKTCNL